MAGSLLRSASQTFGSLVDYASSCAAEWAACGQYTKKRETPIRPGPEQTVLVRAAVKIDGAYRAVTVPTGKES